MSNIETISNRAMREVLDDPEMGIASLLEVAKRAQLVGLSLREFIDCCIKVSPEYAKDERWLSIAEQAFKKALGGKVTNTP